jgi:hypothetical protein
MILSGLQPGFAAGGFDLLKSPSTKKCGHGRR